MAVPTYDKFIEPLLRFLAQHPDGVSAREAHEAAATTLGVSVVDKQEMLPSGVQPIYKNRAGWAHDRLKRAGLSTSPRRGYWKLTDQGHTYVAAHPTPLSSKDLSELAVGFMDVRLKTTSSPTVDASDLSSEASNTVEVASPDDRLWGAIAELRKSVIDELLDLLAGVSPAYFESIVLDLLHSMGYGTSRTDLQRVGGSGDGGIDGVISLDKLGLEKVYVQAKRWQQSVGRPEVQAFYGGPCRAARQQRCVHNNFKLYASSHRLRQISGAHRAR